MIDAPFSSPDGEPSMEEGDEENALAKSNRNQLPSLSTPNDQTPNRTLRIVTPCWRKENDTRVRLWWVNTLSKLPKRSLAESPMSRARERATAWVAILGNSQKSLKNGTWAITTHRRRERVSWTRAWRVACSRATSWWDEKEIRWTKNVSLSRSLLPEPLLFFLPKERERRKFNKFAKNP